VQAIDHQLDPLAAVASLGGIGGVVGDRRLVLRPRRPHLRIEGAALVVGVEAEAFDQRVGGGTAGAAENAVAGKGQQRLTAMAAGVLADTENAGGRDLRGKIGERADDRAIRWPFELGAGVVAAAAGREGVVADDDALLLKNARE
jgi:hypothetical protein